MVFKYSNSYQIDNPIKKLPSTRSRDYSDVEVLVWITFNVDFMFT